MKMKKLLALLLCLLMVFSMMGVLSACGDDEDTKDDDTSDVADDKDKDEDTDEDEDKDEDDNNENVVVDKKTSVEKFVEENYDELLEGMASSMAGSGYDFDCDIAAKGYSLIVTMGADEFNGLTAAQKQQIQDLYDSMGDQMAPLLDTLRTTMPELQTIEYKFYDGEGNFVANMIIKESDNKVDNSKIVSFVNANKAALINEFETNFTEGSDGLTCEADIKVVGMGYVITVRINEIDNMSSTQKKALQDTYDQMDADFEASLQLMQTEVPELEYYQVIVCDKDGDQLAVVTAGNK